MIAFIIIIVLVIVVVSITIYFLNKKTGGKINALMTYHTMVVNSENHNTILRALRDVFSYDNDITFININNHSRINSYDNGIDTKDLSRKLNKIKYNDLGNNSDHYYQGYVEISGYGNYSGIKHSSFTTAPGYKEEIWVRTKTDRHLLDSSDIIKENLLAFIYVSNLERLVDGKTFYYVNISQPVYQEVYSEEGYISLCDAIEFLKKTYSGDYIIVGNFGVQGHEKVFKHYLGEENYHILPLYKTCTRNSENGVYSPDGIVISKKLYKSVEYKIDFYPGNNFNNFLIYVKMHIAGLGIAKDITSYEFNNYIESVKKNHGERPIYIGDQGKFDPEKMKGNSERIAACFEIDHMTVFKNEVLTEKLKKIS